MLQANFLKRIAIASLAEEDLLYILAPCHLVLYIQCIRSSILYVIRCLTGSQCSLQRTGVMCSELRVLVTSRAAQFCTYCSLSITNLVKPYGRALQKSSLDEYKCMDKCLSIVLRETVSDPCLFRK